MKNYYKNFKEVIFRTPFFSLNKLINDLQKLDCDDNYIRELVSRNDVQEAIFFASPSLYESIKKIQNCTLSIKEQKRVFYSIVKYITRMSSRCTPFGLFAGCSIASIGNSPTEILLSNENQYKKHIRLDMHFLCNLAFYLAQNTDVKNRILYYTNSTCYRVGEQIRYIEYKNNDGARKYHISSVHYTEALSIILNLAKDGVSINSLISQCADKNIDTTGIREYIEELIKNQILISELEPNVTGEDYLSSLIKILSKYNDLSNYVSPLKHLQEHLNNISSEHIGTGVHSYINLEQVIKNLNVPYKRQLLFQCDLFKPCRNATINSKIQKQIAELFTYKLYNIYQDYSRMLRDVLNLFYSRYEEMEIPLLKMLDIDIGIDYKHIISGGEDPLLDGINFKSAKSMQNTVHWDHFQETILKKVLKAYSDGKSEVELVQADFEHSDTSWEKMPNTVAALCEVWSNSQDNELIYLRSVTGLSAASTLSRFSHLNKSILSSVLSITDKEEELLSEDTDAIYAEFVHLPEPRVGNILARPILRKYEIPFGAQSKINKENIIHLDELYVSLKNDKLVLRSRKLNKQIIPILTNAHDFSYRTIPIYEFLCCLHIQYENNDIAFMLSPIFNSFPFLPRIRYKNIILSPSKWQIETEKYKSIFDNAIKSKNIRKAIEWRYRMGIPQYVLLLDKKGDNHFFINMDSKTSLSVLYEIVKNDSIFILQEYPIDFNAPAVTSHAGVYSNEFIFTFHK